MNAKQWLLSGLLLFMVAIAVGAGIAWWMLNYLEIGLPIRNQQAQVRITEPVQAKADIYDPLEVMVKGTIHTQIPINQQIQVPIKDTVHTMVTFDNEVPIKLQVRVDNQIPLDQMVHVDSKVEVKVLGKTVSLPIRGDIPIKTNIPVHFTIPIDQKVRLKFVAPVTANIEQRLNIPLKTTIDARVPVHGVLQVPVKSQLNTQLIIPEPLDTVITRSNLRIPLKALSLHRHDSTQPSHAATGQ